MRTIRTLTKVFLAVMALLCLTTVVQADVLELKTGERLEGTFKQASVADGVVIEIGGQSITMPLAKVRAIYFGAAPKTAPTASAVPTASAAMESLDALKGLQSVTSVGISYREYASRVLDAKIKVDRYLAASGGGRAKAAIGAAMRYYEMASQVWGFMILPASPNAAGQAKGIERELYEDKECKLVQALITNNTDMKPAEMPYLVGQKPGILWSCAKDKISEAERLLNIR